MRAAKGKGAAKISKEALKPVDDRVGKRKAAASVDKSSKRKARKEKKAKKDPSKPKRPPSAIFVFLEEFRKEFKKENPNVKGVAAVGKAGGDKWKSLSAAEKAPYEALASKRKAEYEKQMKAHNKKQQESVEDNDDEELERSKSEVNDEEDEASGEEVVPPRREPRVRSDDDLVRDVECANIERALCLGATTFSGGADPEEAHQWITHIEQIFAVMRCPLEHRVLLATFLLDGGAYQWWYTLEMSGWDVRTVTWEIFRERFLDQYYPRSFRDAKETEFLQLRQGSMSVAEYEQSFQILSRFASAFVSTEADKCRWFEFGLRGEIRAIVTVGSYATLRELTDAAVRVEASLPARQQFPVGGRRRERSYYGSSGQGVPKRGIFGRSSSSSGNGRFFGYGGMQRFGFSSQPTPQYYPRSFRDAREIEFLQLQQGGMSVAEYEQSFQILSRFASAFVSTEADKCRRFELGLRGEIRAMVTTRSYATLRELIDAAVRVETSLHAWQQFPVGGRRQERSYYGSLGQGIPMRGSFGGASSSSGNGQFVKYGGMQRFGFRSQQTPQSSGTSVGSTSRSRILTCYSCREPDHFWRECPRMSGGSGINRGAAEQGSSTATTTDAMGGRGFGGARGGFQGARGSG